MEVLALRRPKARVADLGLAPSVAHEAIAEANRQLGIAPSGTPREQLDKLVEALR